MILPLIFLLSLCAGLAVLVASILPVFVRGAVRRGVVDRPEGRKDHDRPVPAIGGLVIIPVFMMVLPTLGISVSEHWPLYVALGITLFMGLIDDHVGVRADVKLLGQIVVALVLTTTGEVLLTHLGYLFGGTRLVELHFLAVPFTATCIIFFMNAMNMMDGVDGLCGGLAFVMSVALCLAAVMGGDTQMASVACGLGAVLIGFLVHNMRYPGHKRATVFLGDAGSLCLGLLIAWLGVNITMNTPAAMPPIIMAFVILVPIADTFALFIARVRAGRGALMPGRDHLHHRLLARGFTPGQTTAVILSVAVVLCILPWVLWAAGVSQGILSFLWCLCVILHTARLIVMKRSFPSGE
jgi:UDP-GlcNAc:undecaprenyl-phosphate GlcNAc-1-phosphate transferase